MPFNIHVICILGLLAVPSHSVEQAPPPTINIASPQSSADNSSPGAIALVKRSIDALGGTAAYTTLHDIVLSGSCAPVSASSASGDTSSSQFVWTFAGKEYRYETHSGNKHSILASGHGEPWSSSSDKPDAHRAKPSDLHFQLPYYAPGLVLYRALLNPKSNFALLPSHSSKTAPSGIGVRVSQLHAGQPIAALTQDWYFGQDGLPVQVDFYPAGGAEGRLGNPISLSFSGFQLRNGISLPGSITTALGLHTLGTCTVTSIMTNTYPDAGIFNLQ